MQALLQLRQATIEARLRTGSKYEQIGTRAKAGKVQIVDHIPHPTKADEYIVTPLSEWLPIPDALRALKALS